MQITISAVGPDNRGLADPIIHYVTGQGANIAEIQMYDHDEEALFAMLCRVNLPVEKLAETRHHEQFTTPERMEQYRAETPLKCNGTSEDVASVVLMLVSDAGRFVNGALLDISGGRFLR